MTQHDDAQILWQWNRPDPRHHTVIALTDDACGFLVWLATDGEDPVVGRWKDGRSWVIPDGEADYVASVLGYNGFRFADAGAPWQILE